MAKIGKRKTECLVKDTTVHALRPYWAGYGEIRFDVNVVISICGIPVAEEYLLAARMDWSGKRPKHICRGCWLLERDRQRAELQAERDYLDRMGVIQDEQDDDEGDGGGLPVDV